ncbi:hypothetical protein CVT25_008939 [Psilocybe cyanescens]|uniref:Uncharacterized protein n=1 Tax=Psilocybe cyanescens TaxID=93625 RepID=A0A409XNJ1_PSICY|nr:hypothetical protein CVT25_008939 [Psilocybe cyanescens]
MDFDGSPSEKLMMKEIAIKHSDAEFRKPKCRGKGAEDSEWMLRFKSSAFVVQLTRMYISIARPPRGFELGNDSRVLSET